MKKLLCERFGGKKGQTMIEYAIIIAAIIAAILVVAPMIKKALEKKGTDAKNIIENVELEF